MTKVKTFALLSHFLAIELKCAPYFTLQVMVNILVNGDDTEVYLDDIGAFSFNWDDHLLLCDKILYHLEANGFMFHSYQVRM